MTAIKGAALEPVKRMPDGCIAENIMNEINFIAQALEGFRDTESGKTITTVELLKQVNQWGR